MKQTPPIPEPPDGGVILVGESPERAAYLRDDSSAGATDHGQCDQGRWWLADGVDQCLPGLTWVEVLAKGPVDRLYRQAEVDRLVAEAKAGAGLMPVGKHLIEPGGYCRTDGVRHSPEEIARIEDGLAREPSPEQVAGEVLDELMDDEINEGTERDA